jgi:N-terminal half of MaoC dehydratase
VEVRPGGPVSLSELRERWVGHEFDTAQFVVSREAALEWARACGEQDPRFLDPAHPDFQAAPTFPSHFVGRKVFPEDFPRFGLNAFDAGKCVLVHAPIRPGDTLTAHSSIADIYEKTGRSGSMLFVVHRMAFENQRREAVSVVDWKLVYRGVETRP